MRGQLFPVPLTDGLTKNEILSRLTGEETPTFPSDPAPVVAKGGSMPFARMMMKRPAERIAQSAKATGQIFRRVRARTGFSEEHS